jgi:uncharacterized membrane protein
MEQKSGWPIALKYALILAFATIALNLFFYIINPKSVEGTWSFIGLVQLLLAVAVSIYIFIAAAKVRRDQDLDGVMSYGKSLGFMMRMAMPAALIISFYTFIFFAYINPELLQKIMESDPPTIKKIESSKNQPTRSVKVQVYPNSTQKQTLKQNQTT